MRHRPVSVKAGIADDLEENVWPFLSSRQVVPVIDSVFPLEEAWRAHEHMEASRHVGKIVLTTKFLT